MSSHPLKLRTAAVVAALVLAAAVAAVPAEAGIHYTAVTRTEPQSGQPQSTTVEAWIEGDGAKIQFRDSDNPMAPAGTYLLTQDGGETVFLVDPEEKTYAVWDLEAMFTALGSVMQSGMLNFEVANLSVEKLLEEAGGTMHGLATTHYRYRTTYDLEMSVVGIRRSQSVEQEQDIWSTDALDEQALGLWLRKMRKTGFDELDRLIAAEMEKVQGVALKMEETSVHTGQKGKRQQTTRTSMEVTELERGVTIPASTFEIPEGYRQTEMMAPAGEDEEGGNPLKGLFGRRGNDG